MLPVRLHGWPAGPDPSHEARREFASSVKVTKPLVEQIVSQSHQLPEDSLTKLAQQDVRSERLKELDHRVERIKEMAPRKIQRALDLAAEKGSPVWLTLLPLQDLGFNIRGSSVMRKMNSNRFIFDLFFFYHSMILLGILNCEGVLSLPELCIDIYVLFFMN